jgi:hypothetical protein
MCIIFPHVPQPPCTMLPIKSQRVRPFRSRSARVLRPVRGLPPGQTPVEAMAAAKALYGISILCMGSCKPGGWAPLNATLGIRAIDLLGPQGTSKGRGRDLRKRTYGITGLEASAALNLSYRDIASLKGSILFSQNLSSPTR